MRSTSQWKDLIAVEERTTGVICEKESIEEARQTRTTNEWKKIVEGETDKPELTRHSASPPRSRPALLASTPSCPPYGESSNTPFLSLPPPPLPSGLHPCTPLGSQPPPTPPPTSPLPHPLPIHHSSFSSSLPIQPCAPSPCLFPSFFPCHSPATLSASFPYVYNPLVVSTSLPALQRPPLPPGPPPSITTFSPSQPRSSEEFAHPLSTLSSASSSKKPLTRTFEEFASSYDVTEFAEVDKVVNRRRKGALHNKLKSRIAKASLRTKSEEKEESYFL